MRRMWTVVAAIAVASLANHALAQGTLRIGMTAADIPLTTGQTDNGGEGMRFMGYTVYDGLINWDLSAPPTRPPTSCPGLATSLGGRPPTRQDQWTFKLRPDVHFP